MHPLVENIIENLPAIFETPPDRNPFARKERSGWFHCSDLNVFRGKMDYDFCIRQYKGEVVKKDWTPESALHVAIGQGIDTLFDAAMTQCIEIATTQAELRDEELHLRGTPDFIWMDGFDQIVGDVKSTGFYTFRDFWANSSWPLHKAYFWRQLQAYLMLSETEEGLLIVVDRSGCDRKKIDEVIASRPYYRDEEVITSIQRDVRYMLEKVHE